MKKTLLSCILLLSGLGVFAQSPEKQAETVSAKFGNTVSGAAQAKGRNVVFFEGNKTEGLLCVGHSLTRHGPLPSIGWTSNWGMAASKKENDYVHLLWEKLKKENPDAGLCVATGAYFERNFIDADKILPELYGGVRKFKAKWIVISLGDNVSPKMAAENDFIKYYEKLVRFLNPDGKSKLIITTCWYPSNKLNDGLKAFAKKNAITIVDIAEIAKKPNMKATGLFEHKGVASHPSDAGMAALADAYYKALTQK